jgi:Zn-dependent M16 (insulinase) family peptidase
MGTESEDFVRLTQRIDCETGGIHAETLTTQVHNNEHGEAWLFLRGKALAPQTEKLLSILRDVLLTANLDNRERFRQILLEEKAGAEAGLIPNGHRVIARRMRAHFNEADWVAEQLTGIAQLTFLRDLIERVESDWPSVLASLESLRDSLVNRGALLLNVTADEEGWQEVQPALGPFLDSLPGSPVDRVEWKREPLSGRAGRNEGLVIPAPINYVGRSSNLYEAGYELDGSALVISRYLRVAWLWDQIRVQGGAYGAFSIFVPRSGVFSFLSYRDPNLLETLDVYERSGDFLKTVELDEDELTKAIIGAIGDMDQYQLPDAKGWTSLERHLARTTNEYLQELRDEILSTTIEDFRTFGQTLSGVNGQAVIVVMGGPEGLQAANETLDERMELTRVL